MFEPFHRHATASTASERCATRRQSSPTKWQSVNLGSTTVRCGVGLLGSPRRRWGRHHREGLAMGPLEGGLMYKYIQEGAGRETLNWEERSQRLRCRERLSYSPGLAVSPPSSSSRTSGTLSI